MLMGDKHRYWILKGVILGPSEAWVNVLPQHESFDWLLLQLLLTHHSALVTSYRGELFLAFTYFYFYALSTMSRFNHLNLIGLHTFCEARHGPKKLPLTFWARRRGPFKSTFFGADCFILIFVKLLHRKKELFKGFHSLQCSKDFILVSRK